jgi:hypothetical protein
LYVLLIGAFALSDTLILNSETLCRSAPRNLNAGAGDVGILNQRNVIRRNLVCLFINKTILIR